MPRFLTIIIIGEWGGDSETEKPQSAKVSDNCHFWGGGYSEAHLVFCMGSVYVLHLLFFKYYSLFHE